MKVVIVQSQIKQYRAAFFCALHQRLAEDGIDLRVIFSSPTDEEAEKCDNVELDGSVGIKVPATWWLGNRLVYQNAWRHLVGADLVIVEQASKHLLNYALLANRSISGRKVAFWGHGFNRQGDGTWMGEFVKAHMIQLPDWWFGYTSATVRFLIANGVPVEITTNVQNSIDTTRLAAAASSVTFDQATALRRLLGITPGARVGLYCGALYPHKQIPLLIASSEIIRSNFPDFHLVVLGDGPDRELVKAATLQYPWLHYAGAKFGDDRASYFRVADFMLNPGLVGLGVLDAFAAGLPVFTTDIPCHSPEIEYLVDGYNGVITSSDAASFADAVLGALASNELLNHLRKGASESGREYTMENMVGNFAGGVSACLARKGKHGAHKTA